MVSELANVRDARKNRGRKNYLNGLAAEEQIARHYQRMGYTALDVRWRGTAGELDLVMRQADEIVFVEVKASKTHEGAIAMVTHKKLARIQMVAQEYLGGLPRGQLTPSRVDVACVDAQGQVQVLQNVIGH